MLEKVSVVIPVAPGETAWRQLLMDLRPLSAEAEIVLVGTERSPDDWKEAVANTSLPCSVHWVQTAPGRAQQLNFGAALASREFLWFIHADSRVTIEALQVLDQAIQHDVPALYYFDLAFQADGPLLAKFNAWGANLRSRIFRLPFGDQAFCLSRRLLQRLGGFDETLSCGEDHLLVWKAHRQKVAVRRVPATVSTSARKYRQHRWLRTTAAHLWRTFEQATPQFMLLIASRLGVLRHCHRGTRRLIIFTRCPAPGQCKTRLIPTLGVQGATALHETLVQRTFAWADDLAKAGADVEVHYAGQNLQRLKRLRNRQTALRRFRPQAKGDLGQRMAAAFEAAFQEGFSHVALIGTDCPALDAAIVNATFEHLAEHEVVLGPAADGGYYLLALKAPAPQLFRNIAWGQSTVLADTLARARACNLHVAMLPTLHDIDGPADLKNLPVDVLHQQSSSTSSRQHL